MRRLAFMKQEIDRRGARAIVRTAHIAKHFAKMAAFGMRTQIEFADEIVGFVAHNMLLQTHS